MRQTDLRRLLPLALLAVLASCKSTKQGIYSPIVIPAMGDEAMADEGAGGGAGFFVFDNRGVEWSEGGKASPIDVRSKPSTGLGMPVVSSYYGETVAVAYPNHLVRLNRELSQANCNAHLLGRAPAAVAVSKEVVTTVLGSRLKVFAAGDFAIRIDEDLKRWLKPFKVSKLRFALPLPDSRMMFVCDGSRTLVIDAKFEMAEDGTASFQELHTGELPNFDLQACAQYQTDVYVAGRAPVEVTTTVTSDGESKQVLKKVDSLLVQKWSGTRWESEAVLEVPHPIKRPTLAKITRKKPDVIRQLVVGHGLVLVVFRNDELRVYRFGGKQSVYEQGDVKSAAVLDSGRIVVHDGSSARIALVSGS